MEADTRCPRTSSSSTVSSSVSRVTPATACSSPVTGSRRRRRCSATTSRPSRTSRPRSAPRPGTLAGVSSFQLHFADHDILTPGDRPDVLVAMNPAALKANLGRHAQGRGAHHRHPRLHRPRARPHRLEPQPDRRRHAGRVQRPRARPDAADPRGAGGTELSRKDAGRSKNMFALGLLSWMYSRPTEGTLEFIAQEVREQAGHRGREHRPRSRRVTTSARRPRPSRSPTR